MLGITTELSRRFEARFIDTTLALFLFIVLAYIFNALRHISKFAVDKGDTSL